MAQHTIVKFEAEVKKTLASKSLLNDITYEVVFRSTDPHVLTLGALPGETLVTVEVKGDSTGSDPSL